jgi:hypothetical protein
LCRKISTASRKLFQYDVAPVSIAQKGQLQPRLTFNYHYIFEDMPAPGMGIAQ